MTGTGADCRPRVAGAAEIAQAVRSGEISAEQAVNAHLERIAQVNGRVNALTVVFAERARELADKLDRAISAGEPVGPLAGVPFTVKENIDLTWSATTCGWSALADAVPATNATIVQRMLDAGAIPIGRGNMPDLGIRWDTDNDLFGRTLNPWDASRTPGGSSGGGAVAVATGMTPIGLGNDAGGSLRLPAYAAGVCALRPTHGRVPPASTSTDAVTPLAMQLFAVNGPIARTVDDLDLVFRTIHGADDHDPYAATIPHPDTYDGPRVAAVVRQPRDCDVEPQVTAAVDRAANALAAVGWHVETVDPPMLEETATLWRTLFVTDLLSVFGAAVLPAPLSADSTTFLRAIGETTPPLTDVSAYGRAWARRYTVASAWHHFQRRYPIILGPVSTTQMPAIGFDLAGPEAATELWRRYRLLVAANLLGLPAVALPMGVDQDGLPLGIQVIGPHNGEHIALHAARDIEAAQPTRVSQPPEPSRPQSGTH